jgi:3-oxoacyl-[acyl-carrier protein] reductase
VKHLVITGGSGGLGQAIVDAFASPAWEMSAPGHDELDVADSTALCRWMDSRPVDLLVCAAGITRDAPLDRLNETAWDEIFAVNYQGAADCAAACLPQMIGQGHGHIVFISSYSALHPPIGQVAYAAAKAALLGLTESLAWQHGRSGIRVNAILPGFLETRMTEVVSTRRKAQVLADHHLGRFNTPATVGKFIHHLHEELPHTSGQIFQLDSRSAPMHESLTLGLLL